MDGRSTTGGLQRYRIDAEIGRGAMGVVYRALDLTLEREVALKELVLPPTGDQTMLRELVDRFLREARSAARLSHPNVVQVYDVFAESDRYFIAMELLSGVTLADLVEGRPLATSSAVDIITQVLDAVAAAHAAGVVHRDLKPENIYVLEDGRVKVTDFGIARLLDAGGPQMTQLGTVMGTPGYMAPEQVMGQVIDARADLFAVGVIAYELLSGANPFIAPTSTTTLYRIVNEHPAPLAQPDMPPALAAVIERAMAKEPAQRFQSAAEMAAAFRSAAAGWLLPVDGQANAARPVTASGNKALLLVAGSVVIVGLVMVVVFTSSTSAPRSASIAPSSDASASSASLPTPASPGPAPVPPVAAPVVDSIQTPFWAGFYFASTDQATSEAEANALRGQGMPAVVLYTPNYRTIGTPGKPMWVVGAGPYQSKAEAAAACDQLRALGKPNPYPKVVDR